MVNLTPLDIQNKEFKKSLRGYNAEEVEDFLDDVLRDYELIYKQNMDFNDRIEKLTDKLEEYKNLEETMRQTLLMAQETSVQLKSNTQREAEILLEEARQKSHKMQEEAEWKVEKLSGRYSDVRREMTVYCAKMKSILATQMDIVDSQSKESLAVETLRQDTAQTAAPEPGIEKQDSLQDNFDSRTVSPEMSLNGAVALD